MQFIVPVKGKYTRFTINEDLVKFLVLSLVPPKSKVTYDQFLDKVYTHFHFVIGVVEYSKYCSNDNSSLSNEFKKNSDVFLELLKNSGFLDELSDAIRTSQNENEIMLSALFGLAKLAGFQIEQNVPLPSGNAINDYIHEQLAGVTISRDNKKISLPTPELNALENKLCDWLEFELLHMMK